MATLSLRSRLTSTFICTGTRAAVPGTDLGEIGSGEMPLEVPGYTTVGASGPPITLRHREIPTGLLWDRRTAVLRYSVCWPMGLPRCPQLLVLPAHLAPQVIERLNSGLTVLQSPPSFRASSLWLTGGVGMLLSV